MFIIQSMTNKMTIVFMVNMMISFFQKLSLANRSFIQSKSICQRISKYIMQYNYIVTANKVIQLCTFIFRVNNLNRLQTLVLCFGYMNINTKSTQNSLALSKLNQILQESNKNTKITYQLAEQPFQIPNNIKKQMPIQKNVFQLNQERKQQNKNNPGKLNAASKQHNSLNQQDKQAQNDTSIIINPIIMKSSIMKHLLSQRLLAHFSFFSIFLSCIIIYYEENNHNQNISPNVINMIYLGNFITILMLINFGIGYFVQKENQKIIKITEEQQSQQRNQAALKNVILFILKMIIVSLHPTVFTIPYNYLLHLAIMMRLVFIFRYFIKSSSYHDCRTFRMTDIYGIKSNKIFIFSIKGLVSEMKILHVICVYCFVVLVFTHSLFLVSQHETYQSISTNDPYNPLLYPQYNFKFIDCFQIVLVTLPTIGYGQFLLTSTFQRIIIFIVMISGASMNSFITLIMLKQFQMTEQESNSYDLLNKLKLHNKMDELSQQYIVETINQIRGNPNIQPHTRQQRQKTKQKLKILDRKYKEQYNYCKTRYSQIGYKDTDATFSLFRTSLTKLKLSTQQLNNMIFVLMGKFIKIKKNVQKIKRKIKCD